MTARHTSTAARDAREPDAACSRAIDTSVRKASAMGMTRRILLRAPLLLLPKLAGAQGTPARKDTVLYLISPTDGATVRGPIDVRFGLKNMGVTHAGDPYPNSGHHHLLIDVEEPLDVKEPIPRDKNHLHFGAGETETRIELPPGRHTLQLVLGDAKHYPFDPPVISDKISITVLSERSHAKANRKKKRQRKKKGESGASAPAATPVT